MGDSLQVSHNQRVFFFTWLPVITQAPLNPPPFHDPNDILQSSDNSDLLAQVFIPDARARVICANVQRKRLNENLLIEGRPRPDPSNKKNVFISSKGCWAVHLDAP